MVKPSSDISVIFIYQPPVRPEVSQKWFSHLIFSLHSQAPGAKRRDDSKLSICIDFHLILSFSLIKEQKGESSKKSPKPEQPGSTNLNFQPPFSSPSLPFDDTNPLPLDAEAEEEGGPTI